MKKTIALILAVITAFSIVACGPKDSPADTEPETKAPDIIDEADEFAFDRIMLEEGSMSKTITQRVYPSTWRDVKIESVSHSVGDNDYEFRWFVDWTDGVRVITNEDAWELNIKSPDFNDEHQIYRVYKGGKLDRNTNTLGIDVDATINAINTGEMMPAKFMRGTEQYVAANGDIITVYYNELHQDVNYFDEQYNKELYTSTDYFNLVSEVMVLNDYLFDNMCETLGIDRGSVLVHVGRHDDYSIGLTENNLREQIDYSVCGVNPNTWGNIYLYEKNGEEYSTIGYFHFVFTADGTAIKTIIWTSTDELCA